MLEKIKKIDKKKLLSNLLLIFIIIQPFLDFYLLFDEKVISIFKFSPSTLIRIGIIFILTLLFIIEYRKDKKTKFIFIYGFLVLFYTIGHILNAKNFNSYFEHNFNFSIVTELFYLIRMALPILLILISSKIHYKDSDLIKVIVCLLLIISGSIVFFNLIGFSLGTYSHEISNHTIFDWFSKGTYEESTYYTIATKGFFMYGNQVSALLLFLNIVVLRYLIVKDKLIFYILTVLNLFAMLMLGTKTATLGVFASIFAVIIIYFILFILKKIKFSKRVFMFLTIMCFVWIGLYNFAPANDREVQDSKNISTSNPKQESDDIILFEDELKNLDDDTRKKVLTSLIGKNYKKFGIPKFMIEDSYNYKGDPEFWLTIFKEPFYNRYNYRFMEEAMLKRVKDINNKKSDDIFGITYSRMSNIMPYERDFKSHYYTLGILGVILFLGPYLYILARYGIYMLLNLKERFNLDNLLICMSISVLLLSAYNSGNVLDSLFVNLIFAFFLGQYARIYEKIK